jgi:hypothetical protein
VLTGGLRAALAGIGLAVVLGVLTGCSGSAPEPAPATTVAAPTPAPIASTPAPAPTLDPSGGAAANKAFFDAVNQQVLAQDSSAGGRAFIDALTAAGFDKAAMEVTPDRTAADLAADSIQFSIRFSDGCLAGQAGPATGYDSLVTKVLGTGRCLMGTTRPIDW